MYPSKEEFVSELVLHEKFNNFQYWREPVQEVSLVDIEYPELPCKESKGVLSRFDSFLYWRDPIPDCDDLELSV